MINLTSPPECVLACTEESYVQILNSGFRVIPYQVNQVVKPTSLDFDENHWTLNSVQCFEFWNVKGQAN